MSKPASQVPMGWSVRVRETVPLFTTSSSRFFKELGRPVKRARPSLWVADSSSDLRMFMKPCFIKTSILALYSGLPAPSLTVKSAWREPMPASTVGAFGALSAREAR